MVLSGLVFGLLLDRSLRGRTFQRGSYFHFEVLHIELIEKGLILHQLDLQVLIRLVMVGDQVVDGLEQRRQTLAVIFLL